MYISRTYARVFKSSAGSSRYKEQMYSESVGSPGGIGWRSVSGSASGKRKRSISTDLYRSLFESKTIPGASFSVSSNPWVFR